MQIADEFPKAVITGVDLAPYQPKYAYMLILLPQFTNYWRQTCAPEPHVRPVIVRDALCAN